jgi:hypothetical protein
MIEVSSMPCSLLARESKLPEPDVSAPQLTADLNSLRSLGGYWKYTLVSMLQALNLPVSCLGPLLASELISDIVHPFLGPLLIITYALLSNTLLLTVLVAILGNTFATINADAAAEVSWGWCGIDTELSGSQCFVKQFLRLKVSKQVSASCRDSTVES